MDKKNIRELLVRLAAGAATVDEVMEELREEPFRDLGFAKIDSHRSLRQGIAEVIYGAGKRPEQIAEIAKTMLDGGQKTVLITRMDAAAAREVALSIPLAYHEVGRVGIAGEMPEPDGRGTIVVATGGTGGAHSRSARQQSHAPLRRRRRGAAPPACAHRRHNGRKRDSRDSRHGGRSCKRHRRPRRLPRHSRPDQRRLRRVVRRPLGAAFDAQLLRERRLRRQHRQRLRRGLPRQHDQPHRGEIG